MSDVGSWEPDEPALADVHRKILDAASKALGEPQLGLSAEQQNSIRQAVRASAESWRDFAQEQSSAEITNWIRALTRAEMMLSGFELGARSPVIALIRLLKQRGEYPDDLTEWVKEHTDNRFLPYGSLSDRL
ncbi:MAG: hypothetical protein MK295_03515 [Pseudomonadales bacterium]|nr:hypothetical protein [Gammaproteobacteria bacterium]MCH2353477.1 hypothetical protein [Pseudomonadales bacterium]MEC9239255.1 hypothetical protein [Pseudomonadota bacterium]|tara:strand:- start:237 stop:632 length:396 start_codon:yes stop_codon:yes gene_type:complete